jgi:hypothetical protein
MNPLVLLKTVTLTATSVGTGYTIGTLLKLAKPANLTLYGKIAYGVGGLALSIWVGNQVTKAVEEQFDGTVDVLKQVKNNFELQKLNKEIN